MNNSFKGVNVPVPVIILCFVFGAWPVGVVLAILRSMYESSKEKEEAARRQEEYMRRAGPGAQGSANYRAPGMDGAQTGAVDVDMLRRSAMYTSRANLDAMSERVENVDFAGLIKIAPFLSREALGKLALRANNVEAHSLIQLAPFLSEQTLDVLVERADGMTVKTITALAPFLSQQTLTRLAGRKYDPGTDEAAQSASKTSYSVPQGGKTGSFGDVFREVGDVLRETLSETGGSMGKNYGTPPPFVPPTGAKAQYTTTTSTTSATSASAASSSDAQTGTGRQSGKRAFFPRSQKFTSAATVLSTIAFVLSLIFSLFVLTGAATDIAYSGLAGATMGSIVTATVSSSITALIYLYRRFSRTRDYRIMTYLSALRGERFYSIKKLADIADTSTPRVIKDLQYMSSKGLLGGEVVIDRRLGYVILFKDARAEAEKDAYGDDVMNYMKSQSDAKAAEPKSPDETAAEMSEHEKILHRIRELNDDIDDVAVSEKIDKIEDLTRKIFNLVEQKPEMEPQLGTFLSYYLPTTLKLLNSYAYFEDQGIRGENIDAGMRNIEETLDMLIDGYKTQFDKLFESEALDVTTDINVLEQMMKADGFTRSDDFNVRPQQSQQSQPQSGEMFGGGVAFAETPDDDTEKENK